MASLSFAGLDQAFSSANNTSAAFSSVDAATPTAYSFITSGGHDWDLTGAGLVYSGSFPSGGSITALSLDLDNDAGAPELTISGVSIAATDLGIGTGTADEQRDAFWAAVLSGADTLDFTLANFAVDLIFAGDGANISDGGVHLGAADSFLAGSSGLSGTSLLAGDYLTISSGDATGGDDAFTASGAIVVGDFQQIDAGAFGVGGDDTITPARLVDTPQAAVQIAGDASIVSGQLFGGRDLIDLRSTNVSAYTKQIVLAGDLLTSAIGSYLVGGDDTIFGSTKGDMIFGDEANDALGVVEGGNDQLFGVGGADTIVGGGGDDTIGGGAGADVLVGGTGADLVQYSDASVSVTINLSTQTVSGGVATGDVISGFEHATGGSAADLITGSQGAANFIDGNAGADTISGLSGDDSLLGGAGDDLLTGGAGADSLDGGTGTDTADYSDATGAVTVSLNAGTGTGDIAQGDVLSLIENVAGGDFNDVLTGAHGVDNWLGGGFGNDDINGFSGNDTILGGGGNDTLTGNFGADVLDGGAGIDLANYSDATARVVVRLWNGTGEGNLAQGDVLTNIENLNGSNFNDILFGADGVANFILGGAGPDYLNGLSGNDTLVGGAGNDSLAGGSGADRLDFSAGSGADRVFNMITGAGVFDVIRITGYGAAFDTFAEILAATTQVGADSVINLGGGNTITLVGTLKTSLVADDFTFV